ncbi:alpha/beta fold hydrolase [Bremerella cremea]|uniref:alpha/beta fold hydrolase n=1 Tax=Bremerella cremea TaxID=1031537 RepID=UPI001F3ED0DF|nr:alpha/beta hydrolase [Bremerella cremea]
MISEELICLGAASCNVARAGRRGTPLVMLHGVTRRWQTFLPILPSLAARWDVWALDFRGHGLSESVDCEYRVVDYVPDAVEMIRRYCSEPAIIYGHSLGAMVAAAVAAEEPELVRAVILEDPPFETMGNRIAQTRLLSYFQGMHQIAGSHLSIDELVSRVANLQLKDPFSDHVQRLAETRDAAALRFTAMCLAQLDPAALKPIVAGHWLDGYQLDGMLSRITCPVLLLQADPSSGGMLAAEDAQHLHERLSSCTKVNFAGTGHLIHSSKPQEITTTVHNFLESLEDQRIATSLRAGKEPANENK